MSLPKVVHCKKASFDVYIGRPSKWGNPIRLLNPNNDLERIECLIKYRKWLEEHPEVIEMAKNELKGKVLGCWCAPRPCHGDVLWEVANA